ncbi:uncharacterized protein [Arachis hypogaea]|uniref:uncharacterized protein n=1 Tax=Arachis hypogaea TaxID=3818 RepID=UPI003B20E848
MEKGKAIAQSSGVDKGKEVDLDEEYFEEGDDEMVGTILIIPTEYLGEYEGDLEEDYDMEAEEAFSFIRYEDEPCYFLRPTERQKSHLRPLHITTTLSGIRVNKVLIDGGAAISLLPERMLMKVGKHLDDLVPTNIAVTDFSGSSTPAKGLVTLDVKVGSSEQNTVFVVVPSKASYNTLLGRDWIHGVGVVPSTMHQSVLLWTEDGKPDVIKADSNLYVELLHVDFRMHNPKLKPLNVDRTLNSYNCEGCYLSSEGLSVKLRYPQLNVSLTSWDWNKSGSSNRVESCRNISISISSYKSMSSIDFGHSLNVSSSLCNESDVTSQTADLIAEAHCVENRRYNQIFIAEDDVSKTTFHCPGASGTYEWVVMPFGLKNAGATYQCAMNAIFHEFIGKFMEVYIDDVMVKSISVNQHIDHLRKAFVTMRKKGLKMNHLKCAFGVFAENFLGFVVHKKGIAIDKSKADAILALSAPKSKEEVQSFLEKVNYLRRFISNLSYQNRVFAPLVKLKNDSQFEWTINV